MVEVLGFLMLGGLFTAHITGNLVVIAALLVHGIPPNASQILAVPTFAVALVLIWLISRASNARGASLLRPLALMEFVLLIGVLLVMLATDAGSNPDAAFASVAAIIATSAIACQFALMRLAVPGAPSTAVMTGNLTNSILSGLDLLVPGRGLLPPDAERFHKTSVIVVAFCVGGVVGALGFMLLGGWAWGFPIIPCAVTLAVARDSGTRSSPSDYICALSK
jgi:uncharacterized membrane protein YoaK (UPF0700 family)